MVDILKIAAITMTGVVILAAIRIACYVGIDGCCLGRSPCSSWNQCWRKLLRRSSSEYEDENTRQASTRDARHSHTPQQSSRLPVEHVLSSRSVTKQDVAQFKSDHLDDEEEGGETFLCSICIHDICVHQTAYFLECRHAFHASCLEDWSAARIHDAVTCPTCRTPIISLGR